jgi:hypothetical protein
VIDDRPTQPPPRARPVAGLPVEAVLERAEELARHWIVALLRARPLEAIGELPLAALAAQAPALCAQTVRAVQSEAELSRLTGAAGGDAREGLALAQRIAALAGARDAGATVQAVEALRGVLWEALLAELSDATAREVGDLGDRLAYVCAATLAVAVSATGADTTGRPVSVDDAAPAPPRAGAGAGDRGAARAPRHQAVIVDELALPDVEEQRPAAASSWGRAGEIEIRDVRGTEGPAAWITSIGSQLERFEHDRLPFAVLLVEVAEIERLSAGGHPESHADAIADVEQALASVHGARGSLTRERPGRYWLVAAGTDRGGARQHAERLARAVAACARDRQGQLEVAIGTAVCPDDGHEAAVLAALADVGLYADRSAVRAAGGRRSALEESI